MPVTALDPKTALIMIDLQKGIVVCRSTPDRPGGRAREQVRRAFRRHGLPVVLFNVAGPRLDGRNNRGHTRLPGLAGTISSWS